MSSAKWAVLLIEDNPMYELQLTKWLQSAKVFHIEVSRTLGAGLDRIRQGGIDVVVLDLHLPDSVSPVDTLRHIQHMQQQAPATPFVVLTGDDSVPAAAAILEGAQDFLLKTDLRRAHFLETLIKALSRHKVRAEFKPLADALTQLGDSIRNLKEFKFTDIEGDVP